MKAEEKRFIINFMAELFDLLSLGKSTDDQSIIFDSTIFMTLRELQ